MLVFIDESGDPGLDVEKGASKFFVVALVVFEENEEAENCDKRIELLRSELRLPEDYEFHFKSNSKRVRTAFLEAVAPYSFFYFGIVLNKDPKKLWGEGFKTTESLYKYACGLVFQNAKPYLKGATVTIDRSGRKQFRSELRRYLRKKVNIERSVVKKVKSQRSSGNNLLQLVDYVAGVTNRKVLGKKDADFYGKFIATKEMRVQVWPK